MMPNCPSVDTSDWSTVRSFAEMATRAISPLRFLSLTNFFEIDLGNQESDQLPKKARGIGQELKLLRTVR